MIGQKKELRNRTHDTDRPRWASDLRVVPIVPEESKLPNRCRKGKGHSHVFHIGDRYGCCETCGDEVLT